MSESYHGMTGGLFTGEPLVYEGTPRNRVPDAMLDLCALQGSPGYAMVLLAMWRDLATKRTCPHSFPPMWKSRSPGSWTSPVPRAPKSASLATTNPRTRRLTRL